MNEVEITITANDRSEDGFRSAKRNSKSFADGLVADMGKAGTQASASLAGPITSSMSSLGSVVAPLMSTAGLAIGAALGIAVAAAAGAAIVAGILLAVGGGVLAAGIIAAANSPGVKSAFGSFASKAKDAFKDFGTPFQAPLIRAANTFGDALARMAPSIKAMGANLAPVIDKLAPALAAMAEKALPGIVQAANASKPLFDVLAAHLPRIGEAVSRLFTAIAGGSGGATTVLNQILTAIEKLIPAIGRGLGFLSRLYGMINSKVSESGIGSVISDRIVPALRSLWGWIQDKVIPVINDLRERALGTLQSQFTKLQGTIKNNESQLRTIGNVIKTVAEFTMSTIVPAMGSMARIAGTVLATALRVVITVMGTSIRIWSALATGASNATATISGAARTIVAGFQRLSSAASTMRATVVNAFVSMRNGITGAFSGAASWLYSAGRNIINGLVSGIKSAAGTVSNAVKSVIPDKLERFVGFAHGGVVGAAASGGVRSNMTLVGERGPELVNLAPGSQVTPAGQTAGLLAGGSGGGGSTQTVVSFAGDLDTAFATAFMKLQRSGAITIASKYVS